MTFMRSAAHCVLFWQRAVWQCGAARKEEHTLLFYQIEPKIMAPF